MNSTIKCIYKTQKEAIKNALEDAKKAMEDLNYIYQDENNYSSCSEVALISGDTLTITVYPKGKVKKTKTAGWNMGGLIYMSKKVSNIYK